MGEMRRRSKSRRNFVTRNSSLSLFAFHHEKTTKVRLIDPWSLSGLQCSVAATRLCTENRRRGIYCFLSPPRAPWALIPKLIPVHDSSFSTGCGMGSGIPASHAFCTSSEAFMFCRPRITPGQGYTGPG